MQKIARSFRSGIELDFVHIGNLAAMRDDHAVNRAVRCNGNTINDSINRVAQKFEAGDKRNIALAVRESFAKRRWMIERHRAWPSSNERKGIKVFDAADAKHSIPGASGGRALRFTCRQVPVALMLFAYRSCAEICADNSYRVAPVHGRLPG